MATEQAGRILLVEDDERLGRQMVGHLAEAGFEPIWVRNGRDALEQSPAGYVLAILDLMLPGAHGLEVLKRFRRDSDVPVLILSAVNETPEKVRALELGADDYLTKPFWPEELIARIQARLRRPALERDGSQVIGEIAIDVEGHRIHVRGEPVELTRVEFGIVAALARRPGAAVTRSFLLEHVLDPDREATERTLDVHVSRLRKKLGVAGKSVVTVWGVGYRLEVGGGRQ